MTLRGFDTDRRLFLCGITLIIVFNNKKQFKHLITGINKLVVRNNNKNTCVITNYSY